MSYYKNNYNQGGYSTNGKFCKRCKRDTHYANNCYAKTRKDGSKLYQK